MAENRERALIPEGYRELLSDLKERIRSAQLTAALSVNRELIALYWHIGRAISERQESHGWGTQVIDRLSADLRRAFPDMRGFSPRNLRYMRAFATAYPEPDFWQQAAANLPWGHVMRLLDTVPDPGARAWYSQEAIAHGWSRAILTHQIEAKLYERQGRPQTNFTQTLPAPQSDLARQVLKDPYNFDFLSLGKEAQERDLERGLIAHIQEFLLELGVGFAFLGSQYRLEVDGRDYYIDLLRHPDDQPSIGLILCKGKSKVVAEYALRGATQPIGVSAYTLTEALPERLQGNLPTIEELEATLGDAEAE